MFWGGGAYVGYDGPAMRLFVALDLPEPERDALASYQRKLSAIPGLDGARWTPPANLHMTLKFLGEQPDPVVAALGAGLAPKLFDIAPIQAQFSHVTFIPARRPNVVAVEPDEAVWNRFMPLVDRVEALALS